MDLRQLNALVAVAEQRSFSAAARALHTVQSNVSTHIARLERELGATLVDRASGQLTEQGVVVADRARRIQAELDALLSDVTSLNAEVSGGVRIGMIGTTARWLAPLLFDAMRRDHPRVHLVIVDATTTSLVPQVRDGRLDLAVVNLPLGDPDLDVEPLFEEDRVLVAPLGHHLAGRTSVRLEELHGEPLLLEPQGTTFRDELDQHAAAAGCTLVAQAEVDGMRLLASLAFQGFGAALLPASAAPSWIGGDWTLIAVEGLGRRSVGIATRRNHLLSAAARSLRDVLRAVVVAEAPRQASIDALVPSLAREV